ncbi:hypothetical protein SDC9_158246 [bioreactor metagenome]|uniref:Uncharacterized protein n=1 Tax=bioreactor metagenome TaxID=1076179 RepID=A0A645F999_9ZZZZ
MSISVSLSQLVHDLLEPLDLLRRQVLSVQKRGKKQLRRAVEHLVDQLGHLLLLYLLLWNQGMAYKVGLAALYRALGYAPFDQSVGRIHIPADLLPENV